MLLVAQLNTEQQAVESLLLNLRKLGDEMRN